MGPSLRSATVRAVGHRRRRLRRLAGAVGLALTLLVTTAACGSSRPSPSADPDPQDEHTAADGTAGDGAAGDGVDTEGATFCEVWRVVDTSEGTGDIEADYRFLTAQLEVMAATVPDALVGEVDELAALFDADAELLARYDWDYAEVFADPDAADELEAAFEREDQIVARLGNGPLARHAFEQCDGVADPRFNLSCNVAWFEPVVDPDTTAPTTATVPDPTDPADPPDELADDLLADTEGAVAWVSRPFADGGGHEYAFVGADDIAVRVVQFSPDADGWRQTNDVSCEGDEGVPIDLGESIPAD